MRPLAGAPPDPALVEAAKHARLADPFALLGPHGEGDARCVRVFLPGAVGVSLIDENGDPLAAFECIDDAGLYSAPLADGHERYRMRIVWPHGTEDVEDAYAFGPQLGDVDLHLIGEGRHRNLADALGAKPLTVDGVDGVRFAVWAPNARRVSVVGDFNSWDGRRHPMRARIPSGVWELFVPRVGVGMRYKFELVGADGQLLPLKADPVARQAERAPAFASIVADDAPYAWRDEEWMSQRAKRQADDAPISVYEVHAPSWKRGSNGDLMSWDELADTLIPYVAGMGFTHVELMPVAEHPFGGSWGYQPLGLFAPTARHGDPRGFSRFVDACHDAHLGVIVDWVPAHFPSDAHGLARFDGTALYEHADPREGFHRDWNTLIYNFGRHEVRGFLIASALEWLERHHVDGLRVDAVASMLYRDYSRNHGEWVPNVHGGRENYEAESFLRELTDTVRERAPGAIVIAEESTAWPGVTAPTSRGGLGFHFKWNMGWMHDTLDYVSREPIHRQHHHHEMTFGLVYAWSEKFMLPISHDEVVHGKRSLLGRMPGDDWQRHANLRAYLAFMYTHPGKKLLFMGSELAQETEWNHEAELPWHLLDDERKRGVQRLVRDLNRLYANEPALHARDTTHEGFEWVVGDDARNSVLVYLRHGDADAPPVLCAINLTPVPRHGYRVGVPHAGRWREVFNSDAHDYGGSGLGNGGGLDAEAQPSHGRHQSIALTLPPLGAVLFRAER